MSGELARLREETDPAEVVMSAVAKGRVFEDSSGMRESAMGRALRRPRRSTR